MTTQQDYTIQIQRGLTFCTHGHPFILAEQFGVSKQKLYEIAGELYHVKPESIRKIYNGPDSISLYNKAIESVQPRTSTLQKELEKELGPDWIDKL